MLTRNCGPTWRGGRTAFGSGLRRPEGSDFRLPARSARLADSLQERLDARGAQTLLSASDSIVSGSKYRATQAPGGTAKTPSLRMQYFARNCGQKFLLNDDHFGNCTNRNSREHNVECLDTGVKTPLARIFL